MVCIIMFVCMYMSVYLYKRYVHNANTDFYIHEILRTKLRALLLLFCEVHHVGIHSKHYAYAFFSPLSLKLNFGS